MRRRRTESFLLRIVVQEDDGHESGEWRGRVQHIGTGAETSFAGVEELTSFIAMHLLPVDVEYVTTENLPQP